MGTDAFKYDWLEPDLQRFLAEHEATQDTLVELVESSAELIGAVEECEGDDRAYAWKRGVEVSIDCISVSVECLAEQLEALGIDKTDDVWRSVTSLTVNLSMMLRVLMLSGEFEKADDGLVDLAAALRGSGFEITREEDGNVVVKFLGDLADEVIEAEAIEVKADESDTAVA